MLEHIDPTAQEALSALENASDLQTLDQARVRYLGVNGQFTALLKKMGSLPKEDRPKAGVQINQAKKKLEALLARRKEELEMAAAMPSQATDFSLPGRRPVLGKCHPLTQVTEDIVKSF